MTPVVIDASAGVELAADTTRGRGLRELLPADAIPWVPEIFYIECGAVLRRWDLNLNRIITEEETSTAVEQLLAWPLRIAQGPDTLPRRLAPARQHHLPRCRVRSARRTPRGPTAHR